ncbi:MAG TPA: FHA domain-containing protein [Candidatus Cybelea sp.]|nr:FHA domain-containing protein [Candidatus Cybelea sp.]
MEQVIWIEVLSRQRDVAARHRFATLPVRIGRGYHNDLIVDDPHVAPDHAVIERDASGALVIRDLGSINGVIDEHDSARHERVALDDDRILRLGRTRLRVRAAGHAVAPERPIETPKQVWPLIVALGAAVLAIEILSQWLQETAEAKASRYLVVVVAIVSVAFAWSAVWSVVCRVFSGNARFERNLLIAVAGILAYSVYDEIAEFASYSLSWGGLVTGQYICTWLVIGVVCVLHLRVIGQSQLVLKTGVVAALAAVGAVMHIAVQSDMNSGTDQQIGFRRIMPPAFRLAPVHDEAKFFSGIERLKTALDRDRENGPPASAGESADATEQARPR